jgi:hypothetical protein
LVDSDEGLTASGSPGDQGEPAAKKGERAGTVALEEIGNVDGIPQTAGKQAPPCPVRRRRAGPAERYMPFHG